MSQSMFKSEPGTTGSKVVRWAAPLLMIAIGAGFLIFGSGFTAVGIGASLMMGSVVAIFAGWFGRLGNDSERIREQQARDEYLRTGKWPED
ncbi:MAG: hypothetical protein WCJ63_08980 [Actinomycetes bacterium]